MTFGFYSSYIAIWIIVLLQGLLILALLRQLAEMRRLVEQGGLQGEDRLPLGTPAPEFAGLDVRSGQRFDSHSLSEMGGVLLFLSTECTVCQGLADSLQPPALEGLPSLVVFCQGGESSCARFVKRLGLGVHLLVEGVEEIAARYHVPGFPTAIVVDGERKVRGYGHPHNVEDLRQLVGRSLSQELANRQVKGGPSLARSSSGGSQ